jgi:hypothetical protein
MGYRLGGIAAPVVTQATSLRINADRIGALGAGLVGSRLGDRRAHTRERNGR